MSRRVILHTAITIFILFLLFNVSTSKPIQLLSYSVSKDNSIQFEAQIVDLTQALRKLESRVTKLENMKTTTPPKKTTTKPLLNNYSDTFIDLKTHMESKGLDSNTAILYADLIEKNSLKYNNLDPYKIMAVIDVETGGENPPYDTYAISSAGARGIMQIMPFHASDWDISVDDLFIPEVNIERGCFYLSSLIDRFGEQKGILAYNQGEGNVSRNTYKDWYGDRVIEAYKKIIAKSDEIKTRREVVRSR